MDKAFFLDDVDEQRFGVPLLNNIQYKALFFEKPFSVFTGDFGHCRRSFIFGARPIDFWALKLMLKTSDKVYVLQHARNPIRRTHTYKYFWQNRVKLVKWIAFICFVKLRLLIFYRNCKDSGHLIVLFHSNTFESEMSSIVDKLGIASCTYKKLSDPCPLVWGSQSTIPVDTSPIMAFYVDEPLCQTLGIDVCVEQRILLNLLEVLPVDKIYVKLHPRSNPDKYAFCDSFQVVDSIFKNCTYLIGYRSGLLDYSFIRRFDCRLEDMKWVIKPAVHYTETRLDFVTEACDLINEE